MFTIDLLKGRGIPIRSRPEGIAIAVATAVVPVVLGTAMFGWYVHNKVMVSINKQRAANYTAKISELSEAVRVQESLDREKAAYVHQLSEVKSNLGRYRQWSPVLAAMMEKMPDSVVLTGLEVKKSTVKKKVPRKDNPQILKDVAVPVTTLRLTVCAGTESDSNAAIKDFRDKLRSSQFLGSQLDNIVVSQELAMLDGREVMSYEIDCVFKVEL
ncbi:MAG: hypothetical protein JSU94_20180 [Phycisphaerales bacterium]|nr:MAG: hypothetical protein JSU94_20180 [Phycisphaerales bacterium]